MNNRNHKWASRISAVVLLLGIFGGGFAVWDHYYYPIPGIALKIHPTHGYTVARNEFAAELARIGGILREKKQDREFRKQMRAICLPGTKWQFEATGPVMIDGKLEFNSSGEITFAADGTLKIEGQPLTIKIDNNKFKTFERIALGEVLFSSDFDKIKLQLNSTSARRIADSFQVYQTGLPMSIHFEKMTPAPSAP